VKSPAVKLETAPVQDPAGLDQIILAAGKGVARYFERLASDKLGRPVNFWDGPDGLGAVVAEHMAAAGVPNKRLPELLTPRLVVSSIKRRPRRRSR
jgi:hypothetical protein